MPAMTVTPSFSEDGEGNQTVDFEVHKPFSGYQSADTDYVTDNQGKQHHVMQDAELTGEMGVAYNPEGYEQLCHELYGPDLGKAIQWANNNWDETKVELYDQAMSADDHSTMHQHIESLMHDYYASGKRVTTTPTAKSGSQEQAMSEQPPQSLTERAQSAFGLDGNDDEDYDIDDSFREQLSTAFHSLSEEDQLTTANLLDNGSPDIINQTLDLLLTHYHRTHS